MVFGFPSIIGFSLGTVVANVYGGYGVIDIIGGTIANLLGCTLAYLVSKKGNNFISRFIGVIIETLTISLIVGSYLAFLIPNFSIGLSISFIFLGSFISITILGFTIEEAIHKTEIFKK